MFQFVVIGKLLNNVEVMEYCGLDQAAWALHYIAVIDFGALVHQKPSFTGITGSSLAPER